MIADFLSTVAFAQVVGISRQKAHQALKGCANGGTWRGVRLNVRLVPSRSGAAVLAYEVDRDSIPQHILPAAKPPLSTLSDTSERQLIARSEHPNAAISAILAATPPPAIPPKLKATVCGDSRQADWRLSIIQPIRHATAPRSAERAELIAKVAAEISRDWRGRPCTLGERTIRGWIAQYEAAGLLGLMRKAPKNAGERRVHLSRAWDAAARAAGLSEAAIGDVVAKVRKRVRGEWASGTPSWPTVQLNLKPVLIGLTREAGIDLSDSALFRVCEVPRRIIEAERRYAIVALARKDAAGFAATAIPRIRRDRSHLRPGEWVAADVHHMDIIFRCEDGRDVTPKAVAWMDLATNRARLDFFIMPKGEMIRREHVIQSFVSMCADPDWGVPSRLYTDNGGEYNWSEIATGLSKLKHTVEVIAGEAPTEDDFGVHRARPYNPQGKVIEGLFSNTERTAFSQLPGWIGGDRMRKKTANQGREPLPFPGDEAQLRAALATALAYYHAKPQSGHLRGVSPDARFAEFVANGWAATVLQDTWQLAVAFSQEHIKPVRAGGTLRLDGRDYRADELASFVGRKVLVRQPMFGDRETLFVFTEHGTPLATATPDAAFAFGDLAGAKEQGRRAKALTVQIRAAEAEADPAAAGGERAMGQVVAMFQRGPSAMPPAAVIQVNPEHAEAARMAKTAPARAEEAIDRKQSLSALQGALANDLAEALRRAAG